jgi:hypothetical protein
MEPCIACGGKPDATPKQKLKNSPVATEPASQAVLWHPKNRHTYTKREIKDQQFWFTDNLQSSILSGNLAKSVSSCKFGL